VNVERKLLAGVGADRVSTYLMKHLLEGTRQRRAVSRCERRGPRLAPWGLIVLTIATVAAKPWMVSAAAPACPAPASVVVFADNTSADANVNLIVEGELRDAAATCDGAGAVAYSATFACHGSGVVRCGTLAGLRPGGWIHRVSVTVGGSAPQSQARQSVVLADVTGQVSNALTWTVYPRTFVVAKATETAFRAALTGAAAFTASHAGVALVTFDRTVFPGASSPVAIGLKSEICDVDNKRAGLCFTASRVVVDTLDVDAERGAVVLAVAGTPARLLRIYGADDVFRGLVFAGSVDPSLTTQADTVSFTGAGALRDRLEQCIVRGPGVGDAVSVELGAGQGSGDGSGDAVLDDCEVSGARDKGLKVTSGGHATVRASCVHDNHNGGLQSTLGGTLTALHNLVQHNVPGNSQSGISAGALGDGGARNALVTDGNIVRFSGARGIAAVDAGDAIFRNDYVADNQFTGARVETNAAGIVPSATFRGVALVCNHNGGITGTCRDPAGSDDALCISDADCCADGTSCCAGDPGCSSPVRCVPPAPQGFGAVVAACAGCEAPQVDFGTASAPGENALTLNVNAYPNAEGANFLQDAAGIDVDAHGNQWEHCGDTAVCDTGAVTAGDLLFASGATVDLGTAAAPRAGIPMPLSVSVGRPRAGDLVRIFGRNFNAVDGVACAQTTVPDAPCSAENPRVAQANHASRFGNRVLLTMADATFNVDIDAVTPTMLAFRMPIDCFAPATLEVSKRDADEIRHGGTIDVCDASGCLDQAASTPCEDGNACSVPDTCGIDGRCMAGPPRDCGGACMRCDAELGCLPRASTAPCNDGNPCTTADHCRGDADVCVSNVPTMCDDAEPCTSDTCDGAGGCIHQTLTDYDAVTCRLARNAAAITSTFGIESRRGRLLNRMVARVIATTERARTAQSLGTMRKARFRLDSVRNRLKAWIKRLPQRRALTPELSAELLRNYQEALAVADQLRLTLL
jgi:hypothetical protein